MPSPLLGLGINTRCYNSKMHRLRVFGELKYLGNLIEGFILLGASLVANYYAAIYAAASGSGYVEDIVLSNTRVYDVDGLFTYGAVFMGLFIVIVCIWHVRSAPFVLKTIALFVFIRSFAVSLTHISPYPLHMTIHSTFFNNAYFNGIFGGDDLFFSGHTGLPFLLALVFWDFIWLRITFLSLSVIFAGVVLLGHIHYSIDVFSAFFITYGIFHLALRFFGKDWQAFEKSTPQGDMKYVGEKIA